ncbi:MAG: hypothetical protein NTY39_01950 [Campylobacterales bacterium]|nr:hypothetical protein [Campylobacterales bacterium]
MAGVAFSFDNFKPLVDLNIGIAKRLDENRSESFTLLFCDFSGIDISLINTNLPTLLRTSDSIVHCEEYYFFVMPYTDRYGCAIVKRMIENIFTAPIPTATVCYPVNGENTTELFDSLHLETKKIHGINLECLYKALEKEIF